MPFKSVAFLNAKEESNENPKTFKAYLTKEKKL